MFPLGVGLCKTCTLSLILYIIIINRISRSSQWVESIGLDGFRSLFLRFLQINHIFWLVWEHLGLTRGWGEGLCMST